MSVWLIQSMFGPVPTFVCVAVLLGVQISTCTETPCYPGILKSVDPVLLDSPLVTAINRGGHNTTLFPRLTFGCRLAVSHATVAISSTDSNSICALETGVVRFEVEFWRRVGAAHLLEARHTAVGRIDEIHQQCTASETQSKASGIVTLSFRLETATSGTSRAIVHPGYVLGIRVPLRLSIWPDASESSNDMPPATIMNASLVYQRTLQPALHITSSSSPNPVTPSNTAQFRTWPIYLAPCIGFLADVSSISPAEEDHTEKPSLWELPTILAFVFLAFLGILAILVLLCLMMRARLQVCPKPAAEVQDGNCYYSYPRALSSGHRRPTKVVQTQASEQPVPNPEPYIFPKPQAPYVNVRTPLRRTTTHVAPQSTTTTKPLQSTTATTKPLQSTTTTTTTNPLPQPTRPIAGGGRHSQVVRTRSSPGNFSTSTTGSPNIHPSAAATTPPSGSGCVDGPVYEDTSFVDADSSSQTSSTSNQEDDYLNTTPRPPPPVKPRVLFPFKFHWPKQLNATDREYI